MVFDRRFGLWGVSLFRWQVCGDPSLYCPVGSAVPTPVSTGYYTVGNDGDIGNTTRVAQLLCPIGHFCAGGLLMQCPGMSGSRRPGVACLTASDPVRFTVRAVVTPGRSLVIAHLFSQSVVAVSLSGCCHTQLLPRYNPSCRRFRSLLLYDQGLCCYRGCTHFPVALMPGGRYGSAEGLSTADCSGQCQQGYVCPAGSTSPRENQCGSVEAFCPPGSARPQVRSSRCWSCLFGPLCCCQCVSVVAAG